MREEHPKFWLIMWGPYEVYLDGQNEGLLVRAVANQIGAVPILLVGQKLVCLITWSSIAIFDIGRPLSMNQVSNYQQIVKPLLLVQIVDCDDGDNGDDNDLTRDLSIVPKYQNEVSSGVL